jgi:hypothetical protein
MFVMLASTVSAAHCASALLIESGHRMSAPIASHASPVSFFVKSGYSVMNVDWALRPVVPFLIAARIAG